MSGARETGATLRAVLALGGGEAVSVVRAPRGLDVAVCDAVLLDEGDLRRADGCVLLAVGVDPGSPRAPETVAAAARAGAAAVVFRPVPGGGLPARVLAAGSAAGVAVLVRSAAADWADAAGALRTAVACAAGGGAGARLGDLAALAALVARLTGGSVTVEDNASRVLAHSHTGMEADELRRRTILGGRVPAWRVDELRRSGLFRAVLAAPGVVHRPAGEGNPERMVVAVRSGAEILGSLWLAPDGGPLPERAGPALEEAARMAVPHLMHHRLRDAAAAARREEAVRGLLTGRGDAAAHALALGLPPDGQRSVLLVVPAGAGADRTLEVLAAQAGAAQRHAVVLREEDRVTVLLAEREGVPGAAALGRRLAALAGSLTPARAVLVGVGPAVAGADGAARSLEAAARVVRVLRGRHRAGGGSVCAREEDVAAAVTLLRMLDAAEPAWRAGGGPLHALVAHERRCGGDLSVTLAAWLDAFGDTAEAARVLNVHANTVRYRLRRARERFGVDLTDPDTRLLAMLALRLPRDGAGQG